MSEEKRTLGHKPIAAGYHHDSMGLQIDPNAYYQYEHQGATLLAIWRTGLNKPKKLQPIVKTNPPPWTHTKP